MKFRFKPQLQRLEDREVPAVVNWTWTPQMGSTAGDVAANWTNDSNGMVVGIPHLGTDNLNYNNLGNSECDLGAGQNALGRSP